MNQILKSGPHGSQRQIAIDGSSPGDLSQSQVGRYVPVYPPTPESLETLRHMFIVMTTAAGVTCHVPDDDTLREPFADLFADNQTRLIVRRPREARSS